MRCKCKLFNVSGIPASDGSIIPRDVVEAYLNSEEYKNAINSRKMLGTLTHRARNLANAPANSGAALSKTIGKDDMLLMINVASPTHYVERLYIENDGWCYADIKILDENGLDDDAIQNIRRLKGLLKQGIMPGCSAVVLSYWQSAPGGKNDVARKIQSIKSLDITLNPSWKDAQIVSTWDDEGELVNSIDKNFSEKEEVYAPSDFEYKGLKVKEFSDIDSLGCGGLIKTSKIGGVFTNLKAKVFSADGMVTELPDKVESKVVEKNFSVASVKDRIIESKLGPRQKFRKIYMSYKQVIRQMGGVEKIDPETLKIMKSLFSSDVLDVMKSITPEIIAGKQINVLIGASSLGKNVRQAAQQLQMPFRQAMVESQKQGFVSKTRYQKIQDAYLSFIGALIEDVFSNNNNLSTKVGENEEGEA